MSVPSWAESSSIPYDELMEHWNRKKVFSAMLFTETEADLLASAEVAPETAQRLLSRGCSRSLAVRILI